MTCLHKEDRYLDISTSHICDMRICVDCGEKTQECDQIISEDEEQSIRESLK